jgi:hypothetical protein
MIRNRRIGFLVLVVILLAGCAGKDFVRPTSETFRLNETTYAQVVQQMGEPKKSGEVEKNGKYVRSISYSYASTGGASAEKGVIPARALLYFFHNGVLVGQSFQSSFKSDNTNFDETKIDRIIKGKTTRSEVIKLLGRPSSSMVAPMVEETRGEAAGYSYSTVSGGVFSGFVLSTKQLAISFDENDVASDVEYTTSSH